METPRRHYPLVSLDNLKCRIFICQNYKIMKNLGKVLDYQKKTADAVEKMMDLLANYYSIGMLYET